MRSIVQALNRHRTLPVVPCPYLQAESRMAIPGRTYTTDDNASIAQIAYGHFKSIGRFILNKAAAVFCAYDVRAQEVVLAAQLERIAMPSEMSVIGVDNDEAICESTRPRITSARAECRQPVRLHKPRIASRDLHA